MVTVEWGAMWKDEKLTAQLREVSAIRDGVVISGGLAWHLMSPDHKETKQIHDHKDVDLFIIPSKFSEVIDVLKQRGFGRLWTKYDGITPNFYRYSLSADRLDGKGHVKVLLDLFVEEVPFIEIKGFKLVEPSYLLTLYNKVHSSSDCTAVGAARKLLSKGISPINRPELIGG